MDLTAYRSLLRNSRARRLFAGLVVSSLGDGMSTVTIAWLALAIAPPHGAGAFVGLALAAYTLPVCKPFVFMVIAWSSWKLRGHFCHIRARWPVYLL